MKLNLRRLERGADGTFGVLFINKKMFCTTLEPSNGHEIATGVYKCFSFNSPKFGMTIRVEVPSRTNILFHPGNVKDDSDGCILLGKSGTSKSIKQRGVYDSRNTLTDFLYVMAGANNWILEVDEVYL